MSYRRSLALSFAQKYAGMVITFGSTMIIARLLTPGEIGVFSVAMAAVALAHTLRDMGFGRYIVQEQDLTHDRLRTAFGMMIITSWTIGAALLLVRPWIADFYREPGLTSVLLVLSLNFFVIPIGAPLNALINRDMRFGALFRIQVPAAFANAVVSIGLAATGHGYMSLAWGSFANVLTTAILNLAHRPDLIGLTPSLKEWRSVVSFSSYAAGITIANELGRQTPSIILGRLIGFSGVGLYSRAEGLMRMFWASVLGPVWQVSFPSFGRARREERDFRPAYSRLVASVTGLCFPFYAFAGLMGLPIIRLLFGDQWDAAVPLLQLLAIAGIVGAPMTMAGMVLTATGHIRPLMFATCAIQGVGITLTAVAAFISLEAVAASRIVQSLVALGVHGSVLQRRLGIRYSDVARNCLRSAGTAAIAMIVPVLVWAFTDVESTGNVLEFLAAGIGWGAGFMAGIFLTRHPLQEEVMSILGQIRAKLASPQ